MDSSFWSGIVGAVLGSLVTGLITWWLQHSAQGAAERQRQSDRKDRDSALGHSLQFKIIRIASTLKMLNRPVQEAAKQAAEQKQSPWMWPLLRPLANEFARVDFLPDELALLMRLKEMDLFNKVADLDVIHNDVLGLFRTFADARVQIDRKMVPMKTETGYQLVLTPEQKAAVQLEGDSVDRIARHLAERCPVDVAQADVAFRLMCEMMARSFGSTLKFADRKPTEFVYS